MKKLNELSLDFTVKVDQKSREKKKIINLKMLYRHPKLINSKQPSLPNEYNLATDVGEFLHNDQKWSDIDGETLYISLIETDMLKYCLKYEDAYSIKRKGLEVFDALFKGKKIFFWGSVSVERFYHDGFYSYDALVVPLLYVYKHSPTQKLTLTTIPLKSLFIWGQTHPALYFKNLKK